MSFDVVAFNEWYKTLDGNGYGGPERKFGEFWNKEDSKWHTPFGDMDYVDEGRELDYPSSYFFIMQIGNTFLRTTGYYDSQEGVNWDEYEGWSEVVRKERTVEYWDAP